MRILFLSNNDISLPLLHWLKSQGGTIVSEFDEKLTIEIVNEIKKLSLRS